MNEVAECGISAWSSRAVYLHCAASSYSPSTTQLHLDLQVHEQKCCTGQRFDAFPASATQSGLTQAGMVNLSLKGALCYKET